jgi:hypothetical protein
MFFELSFLLILQRMMHAHVAAAFHGWADAAAASRIKRALAARAAAHFRLRRAAGAFACWRGFVAGRHDAAERLERALGFWEQRACASAYLTWREYATAKAVARLKVAGESVFTSL